MTMPTFSFKATSTEQEIQKLENEAPTGKIFKPGTYDLKIVEFVHNITEKNPTGMASGDPTWRVYKAVLGGLDTRRITTYVLLPTKNEIYAKPGMKNPKLMFIKCREFFRALGAEASVDNFGTLLNQVFSNPNSLLGSNVSVKIGYPGNHLSYRPEDKSYEMVDKTGKPLFNNRFYPDRDSAQVDAAELGVVLKDFPEVSKFIAQQPKKSEETPTDWT